MSLVCLGALGWAWCVLDNVGQVSMAWGILDGIGRGMNKMRLLGEICIVWVKLDWELY